MKYNPPTGSVDPNAPYVGKNPAIGQQGSKVPPAAIEHVQREILAVIDAAGITPSESVLTQLRDAIQAMIASGGAVDISSAKTVTSGPATSPPGSPAAGDEVLVADSPTGGFAGNARKIARYTGSAWSFTIVRPGRMFRVNNTDTYWTLNASTGWQTFVVPIAFVSGLQAALDAKIALSGGTMTGRLYQGGDYPYYAVGEAANGWMLLKNSLANSAGNFILRYSTSGWGATLDAISVAPNGKASFAAGADFGGDVGIGVSSPADKLDVNGGIRGTKLRATVVGAANGVELADSVLGTQWANYLAAGAWGLYSYVTGNVGQKFAISPAGGVGGSGDFGTTGKVLVGGTTAAWKTFSEIGIGKKLIMNGSGSFINTGSLSVTLPAAEPDALYSVSAFCIGFIDGALQYGMGNVSKTTTGFTVSVGWTYSTPNNVLTIYTVSR